MKETRQDTIVVYAGFWIRVWATIVDTILILLIIMPILITAYGWEYVEASHLLPVGVVDFLLTYVFPAASVVLFWRFKSATPGKMLVNARIVDAETGEKPSLGQFIGRYFAYLVSTLVLLLGFVWVAFDHRKQGWHDKLASTVVIRQVRPGPTPVVFRGKQSEVTAL